MKSRLFIHAPNVHQGGGRSLLEPLLSILHDKIEFILCLDERMPLPAVLASNVQIRRVKPSVLHRWNAERWLARNVAPEDTVLCFGNLPPLFKLQGHTVVFVQNRYLIDDISLNRLPIKVRLRIAIERMWLSGKRTNADKFVVQTPTMKRLLEIRIQGDKAVHILPFVAKPYGYMRNISPGTLKRDTHFDFLYVASGEPHKNHKMLIEAWRLLAIEGLFPSLRLTLDKLQFATLHAEIELITLQFGLNITTTGELSGEDVLSLYKEAGALIYPSTFESFGLPLIEARQAGLPILASELDYVRDVLDPEQTFNPESPISIARAVKRFMGMDEQALPLQDAKKFLEYVVENVKACVF